jgi:hypothetical protein
VIVQVSNTMGLGEVGERVGDATQRARRVHGGQGGYAEGKEGTRRAMRVCGG